QPVGPSGDLQGRKMRGTQTFTGVFKLLGASPVVLPPAEIYSSLEKGVVDGAGWPVIGVLGYRWYEVAKYLVRPTFGRLVYPVFFNLDAWNKLTDRQKNIISEEARKAEDAFYVEWVKLANDEETQLKAKGAQITELKTGKDKLNKELGDAEFDIAIKQDPKSIGELRNFAKSKGLY
ncbi:MAG TPA: TRAP transporter substrate-binding protein DctP, partial [Bryobacteraceae bacterium]|nr:TRAP transporter substrate-binding protein DctP [Bryobacteraceae bacterium]